MPRVYSWRGYNSNVMSTFNVFRTDRIPSLSRIPKELGREERLCERCGVPTEHILYRVPKKVVLVYVKEQDRKSTRLNSSHANISYAVFCLKKNTSVRS